MADDPYTRVYHKLADEYPAINDDAAALGTYIQLLIQADQAWPTAAFVPAFVDPDILDALTGCGLVEMDGKRYRMKGLEKERRQRRRAARKGATERWNRTTADADADALASVTGQAAAMQSHMQTHSERNAIGMPSLAKPSQDEPNRAKTNRTARDRSRGLEPLSEFLGGAK